MVAKDRQKGEGGAKDRPKLVISVARKATCPKIVHPTLSCVNAQTAENKGTWVGSAGQQQSRKLATMTKMMMGHNMWVGGVSSKWKKNHQRDQSCVH